MKGLNRLAGLGQRVAVQGCGRVGRGARYVQKYGAAAAAVDGADIQTDQYHQRLAMLHAVGQGSEQRHAHGGGQTRQHADGNTQQRGPKHQQQGVQVGELAHRVNHQPGSGREVVQ